MDTAVDSMASNWFETMVCHNKDRTATVVVDTVEQ
jgi:hypothetical protein